MSGLGGALGLGGLGGSTLGQVLVRVGLDTKQLDAALVKVEGEVKAAGTGMAKFGAYTKAGFAVAGIAAAAFAASAVKATMEHQKVLANLQIAIGGTTTALEAQAKATSELTGFNEDQILAMDTVLSRFDLSRTSLAAVTAATLDYARSTGKDAVTSAELLGKASLGNARALKALGIAFVATKQPAKDFATVVQLVENKTRGAAAAFAQTFAGKIAIAGAAVHALEIQVGTALLPALTSLVTTGTKVLTLLSPLITEAFAAAATTAGDLATTVEPVVAAFDALSPSADKAEGSTSGLAAAMKFLTSINPVHWLTNYNTWLLNTLGVTGEVDIQTATYTGTLGDLKGALSGAASTTQDLVQAEKDQKAATNALIPGVVGLIGSVDQLRSAQRDLNRVRHDSKATAQDLRTAELGVFNAQLGVTGSMKDLIQKQHDSGKSADEITAKFDAWATKIGFTKNEIKTLNDFIATYIDRLNHVPSTVTTRIVAQYSGGGFIGPPTMPPIQGPPTMPGGGGGGGGHGPHLRGLTVNIISPTDPAQAIVNNLAGWQRQNRDWVG